jgi:hypothetical protein
VRFSAEGDGPSLLAGFLFLWYYRFANKLRTKVF